MLNNTRSLHIVLEPMSLKALGRLDLFAMKRKYPGEHVALVRLEDLEEAKGLQFFHEIHTIDRAFLQRSAFSPLLGDATAFSLMWNTLRPLTLAPWTRVFNLGASPLETNFASLFQAPIVGVHRLDEGLSCPESPLKLARILSDWKMADPSLTALLHRRSLQQLELGSWEASLQKSTDLRAKKSGLKGVLAGVRLRQPLDEQQGTLGFLHQLFTLVALDSATAQGLKALGLEFADWSQGLEHDELCLDLIAQDCAGADSFWRHTLDIRDKLPEELTDQIAELLPRNFTKWACLSFFFDYLAQPKLAHAAEKMLTRYDRQALQPFLYQEVLTLKEFAKVLLDGLRRQGGGTSHELVQHWGNNGGTLSFVAAIELSLHPSLSPLLRHDQDVLAVKNRLRSLNAFYERLHRAMTIDIPKTDLALTL